MKIYDPYKPYIPLVLRFVKLTNERGQFPCRLALETGHPNRSVVLKHFKASGFVWYLKYTERSLSCDIDNWHTTERAKVSVEDIYELVGKIRFVCTAIKDIILNRILVYSGDGEHRVVLESKNLTDGKTILFVVHYASDLTLLSEKFWYWSTAEKVSQYWNMKLMATIQFDESKDSVSLSDISDELSVTGKLSDIASVVGKVDTASALVKRALKLQETFSERLSETLLEAQHFVTD